MENKRGQQMTLGTIIAIVLGIAVLVFLIFGFSTGWGSLWDRITNFGGGSGNIDTIKQACELACTGQSKAAFCTEARTVKYGKKLEVAAWDGSANVKGLKSSPGTCSDFAADSAGTKYPGLNVATCPAITC